MMNLQQIIYGIIKEKSMEDIEKEFEGKGYGDFKSAVAEAIIERLEPLQKKYNELLENPEMLKKIYQEGARKAQERADKVVAEVYKKIGLIEK